ncbi:MAG TPA: hypothetical protein VN253_27740 [Kofleriaceae bacterium]|nr:hypothetical protein [Kofleriaceae bacterium]
MHHPARDPERRRFLSRLLREVARTELQALDHAARETRRLGETPPPASALRAVAAHAAELQPRLATILAGYRLTAARGGLGAALATLRHLVVDGVVDAERAYRIAVLDLRHGVDVVKLLREVARGEQLFGVIRWCDDWLSARRTLVAHAERALAWFTTPAAAAILDEPSSPSDRPWSRDRP